MLETDLILEVEGRNILPPTASQNCVQTLTPLGQGVLHRTVNGELISLQGSSHQKYKSKVSCEDKCAAALENIWPGQRVKVGCLQWLSQPVAAAETVVNLGRIPVGNKVFFRGGEEEISFEDGHWVLPKDHGGGFITYRPFLDMMVTQYHIQHNEWGMAVGWSLDLEEV